MAWRLLMRRSPNRSMTVVGDLAQTGDLGGASSWAGVFRPYVDDRWRLTELTVNYRTPAEIMARAATLLTGIDPALRPPTSVRSTGVEPRAVHVPDLEAGLAAVVREEMAQLGAGRLGVIVPEDRIDLAGTADLEAALVVLSVRQAKGLEFDSVVVADPAGILAESARGRSDLYVAMTRATHRLTLVVPKDDGPVRPASHLPADHDLRVMIEAISAR